MVEKEALAQALAEDSHCLWEVVISFLHGKCDAREVIDNLPCYYRLHEFLAEYYESKLFVLQEAEVWFAQQVLNAYEDIYIHKVTKRN